MEQRARRQILADLGIVPWRLRVLAGAVESEPAADPGAGEPARPGDVAGERAAAADTDATVTVAEAEPTPAVDQAATVHDTPAPAAAQPADEPREAPWSALSLVSGGALLLVEGDATRRDLRLAMDVLGAAAGDFAARPASRRFDWPPPGAVRTLAGAGSAQAGERALLAFVDKDLSDHGVRRVLCTAALDARLPALPEGIDRVTLPELATLGQDPEAKRALWQALKSPGA